MIFSNCWIASSCQLVAWIDWEHRCKSRIDNIQNTRWWEHMGIWESVRASKSISANSTTKKSTSIYTPWNSQLTPCKFLVLRQEKNIKLTFRHYKLHPRSLTVCRWKDDPFLCGAERSLFKARKGLRKFGGICNCDSLTAKASGFARGVGVNRDEDRYLMFIKMKGYCTFAGFSWIKHICRNYRNMCTVYNMYIIIV